jgi:hypothetical protein
MNEPSGAWSILLLGAMVPAGGAGTLPEKTLYAVMEGLAASLDKFGMRPREKSELPSILGKLRADVVENR